MLKKRLLWHLYPFYLVITVLFLAAVTWQASSWLKGFYLERTIADLKSETALVGELVSERLAKGEYRELDALSKRLGQEAGLRITLILPDGRVVADSNEDPAHMENHADRPEVIAALRTGEGLSARKSPTLGKDMMYFAHPVVHGGKVAGVVRNSLFFGDIDRALGTLYRRVALGGLSIAALVAALGLLASRRVGRVLRELEAGAERYASGELGGRLPVPVYEEMARLTEAMNRMAAQLDERIRTITRQRNEQETILSSMVEGVIAVDTSGRIMDMNQAAGRLLKLDPASVKGRGIQEAARNTELREFVAGMLEGGGPAECEILLRGKEDAVLSVHGAPMTDEQGARLGAVVVLSDVTRLKNLERVRRDFVANVSHELRTPITSIRGFAEALAEGGMEGGMEGGDAKRYAGIILEQADRLNEIIEDLMSLSIIERKAENEEITLAEGPLSDVVNAAAQSCHFKAEQKNMRIRLACEDAPRAMINAQLLEQAVVNLIDNAVKYSEPGGTIDVACGTEGGEVYISVRDRGCGIEEKHFPRLFERFYRVDKARSRKAGGTGLGLAIVKHIVQAHGGRIDVKSYPGEGSTFTIRLENAGR